MEYGPHGLSEHVHARGHPAAAVVGVSQGVGEIRRREGLCADDEYRIEYGSCRAAGVLR